MDSENDNSESVIHTEQSELFDSSASRYIGIKHFPSTMQHTRRATQESSDGKTMNEISSISETHLLLNSVKNELQKLIEYNLSGHTHHLSYEIKSVTNHGKTVTPVQHETQEWNESTEYTEPQRTKRAAKVESLETGSDGIPSDILRRSYSNPNFFSSEHSEKLTPQNLQENNLDTLATESPTHVLNEATHASRISHNHSDHDVNSPAKEDERETFRKLHDKSNKLPF